MDCKQITILASIRQFYASYSQNMTMIPRISGFKRSNMVTILKCYPVIFKHRSDKVDYAHGSFNVYNDVFFFYVAVWLVNLLLSPDNNLPPRSENQVKSSMTSLFPTKNYLNELFKIVFSISYVEGTFLFCYLAKVYRNVLAEFNQYTVMPRPLSIAPTDSSFFRRFYSQWRWLRKDSFVIAPQFRN